MWLHGRTVAEFLSEEWGYLFEWQQVVIVAVVILLAIALPSFLVISIIRSRRRRDG